MGSILGREEWRDQVLSYYTVRFEDGSSPDIEPGDEDYTIPTVYEYAFQYRSQVFRVDGNLTPPPIPARAKQNAGVWSLGTSKIDLDTRFCILRYSIGGIPDVYCYWPTLWTFECGAPAPNSYGWIPQAEFGLPVFTGNPQRNANSARETFTYTSTGGQTVTPSLPYDPALQIPNSPFAVKTLLQQLLKGT